MSEERRRKGQPAQRKRRFGRAVESALKVMDRPPDYTIVSREAPKATWPAVIHTSMRAIRVLLAAYGLVLLWMVFSAPRFTLLDPNSTALDYALGAIWSFEGYIKLVLVVAYMGTVTMTAYQALYWPLRVYLNRERQPMSGRSYDLIFRYAVLAAMVSAALVTWLFKDFFDRLFP